VSDSSSQTLTFLFTDLEGSTRLWEDHPDPMSDALALHDELLRDAVESRGGTVVKSTGDGVLATFASATDGVDAAAAAQRALLATTWPAPVDLRVRMGLHFGEATERNGDWYGSDVNRAARVMDAANGGQILCTAPVADRIGDDVAVLDLGRYRLRDLESELRLFQVTGEDLPVTFPPLRTLDAYRSNLPYELSSFVGREAEIRDVAERVRAARLVTIVGVGGVGKTRLALQAASEVLPHFGDGVWLCELAPVLDPAAIPDAVAAALGYTPPQGVSTEDGLRRFLERKDLLLVLDNCEHLVRAVARLVSDLTASAAQVSVLATSREALGVRGEHAYPLASLQMPDVGDVAAVLASEAGALFVARASEARGDLDLSEGDARAVHDLCERLDGIPLAIELAAARTTVMSVTEVLTRLDQQFRLLTGGRGAGLERHQTLRAAIDWSYDLLAEDERAVFGRLSVCVGGFDLDAVVALAAGVGVDEFDAFEILASLVSKSLVERTERDGITRYRQLEMIRQYAAEQSTASGDTVAARDDHARHYLALSVELFAAGSTPNDYDALDRLELETPNIAAAGRWLLTNDRVDELFRFYADLAFLDPFSIPVVSLDELGEIALEALQRPGAASLHGYASAAWIAGARFFFSGAFDVYGRISELASGAEVDECPARTSLLFATMALMGGDLDRAVALTRESVEIARETASPAELAWMLGYLATAEALRDPDHVSPAAEEGISVARPTGSAVVLMYPLLGLANATGRINGPRGLAAAEELMRLDRTRRQTYTHIARSTVATLRIRQGDIAAGVAACRTVLEDYAYEGERSLLTMTIAIAADGVADRHPDAAIELAAIADCNAITHFASFSAQPALVRLAADRPSDVATARERAAGLSYDDALVALFEIIDRLVAQSGGADAAPA